MIIILIFSLCSVYVGTFTLSRGECRGKSIFQNTNYYPDLHIFYAKLTQPSKQEMYNTFPGMQAKYGMTRRTKNPLRLIWM